jgi:transposase
MPAALSEDLRWRIVDALKGDETIDEIATRFDVGSATVKRLRRTFRETKSVAPKPHGGGYPPKIKPEHEPLVEALVQQHPDWREDQYAVALAEKHGIHASAVTVGRVIRRLGYSVKKRLSSRTNATDQMSSKSGLATANASQTSPLRVWFLWTRPVRTRR